MLHRMPEDAGVVDHQFPNPQHILNQHMSRIPEGAYGI